MNTLYPIFLRFENKQILLVGAGKAACEKINFLLKCSPDAQVTVVAEQACAAFLAAIEGFDKVQLVLKSYDSTDVKNHHIVIVATNRRDLNEQIVADAHANNLWINVADQPDLCDFYLGGIVTKGNLKIAISTNGKSPTVAKRLRQWLEEVLPDNIDELLEVMQQYRQSLRLDFEQKVALLAKHTAQLLPSSVSSNP